VITSDPQNARRHPDRNKAVIRQSLEEVGPFRSIAVDGDDIIRAGNGVFEQAQELGLKVRIVDASPDELIAVRRPDLRGEAAVRAAILDNRAGELAEWDGSVLAMLKETAPEALEGMWEDKEWQKLLRELNTTPDGGAEDQGAQEDKAEELRIKWNVSPGQIWEIPSRTTPERSHRLMCGDSTNPDDVTRLMKGERATLFSTDPPYLVNYTGTNHPYAPDKKDTNKDWSQVYKDWDNAEQGVELYDGFVEAALAGAITEDAAWYCWHASRNQSMLEDVWERHGAFVHQQIIWVKDRGILTRSWYMWQHEPCFFGWLKGKKPRRMTEEFLTSVWQFKSPLGNERVEHPTQKPVEVFTIPLLQHTLPGDLCYEPFSGSGTQLVAAEETGRICYAMDKAPQFVAVALERLANMQLEPRLVE
jgi:DNA modification methylase